MFMEVGAWKNYDEMEENISMPEILITLDAVRKREHRAASVAFAAVGVDIDGESESDQPKTAQDVYNETMNEIYGYDVELAEVGITFSDEL